MRQSHLIQIELHSWGPSPSRSRSRGRSATSPCWPSRRETPLLLDTGWSLQRDKEEEEVNRQQRLARHMHYIRVSSLVCEETAFIRTGTDGVCSPDTTSPCLLTAKGRQARFFHWFVTGSKLSTLRSTTLSSSPPTVTITSAVPVAVATEGAGTDMSELRGMQPVRMTQCGGVED